MATPTKQQIIQVKVSAGARTELVEEIAPGILKVRVRPAAERGRANARAGELIAEYYGLPITSVVLVSGAGSRDKRFAIFK